MVDQYLFHQDATIQRPTEWKVGRGGLYASQTRTVPNPAYYNPDRGFYEDGPRNNGKTFSYWAGVDKAYMACSLPVEIMIRFAKVETFFDIPKRENLTYIKTLSSFSYSFRIPSIRSF